SEYFSIKYSYEPWMADMIMKEYGGDAERILAAGNQKPPVFLKVNDIKAGDTDIIKLLKKQGVEAEAVKPVKGCLFVKRGDAVRTDAHEQGMFYVQDLSSQILCGFISPSSKDAVIDVASAPGGKAANFAIAMKNRGQIIAVEPEKPRILLMEQNFVRLGITNVRILGLDATVDIPEFHGKGEKVLVDAPCSALGVIRRHPEKKWCIKEEELKEFPKLQLAILNTVKNWVKKGGALYYSTCTINPGENRAVIEKFLEKNREFRAVDICGKAVKFKEYKKGKYFLSLPGNKDNMDGFFMAKMVRGRT
ncbi:MAG TPA: 16S rRNA (cytosine(967)-C(5))-methyltransferase RsmB, partial [bacterium]|nr:16S rRNA (cytosine(967)-C(5))-methyltransferase RsmB [bacterium]